MVHHLRVWLLSVFFSLQAIETALDCLKSANTEPYYRRQAWEVIKCFLVAMMSLDDNKHALYQLLAHPKYDNSLNINVYVKFIVFLEQPDLETSVDNVFVMEF